ncbi:hypothetical protein, partial [Pseudomonas aeruginosa]|uniref:hypothetical protein n=1 Tax=Pseudomonas aeruginosa TaxID=287 RepID=UPI001C8A1C2E
GLWIPGLGVLLPENQGRLPRESAMNLFLSCAKQPPPRIKELAHHPAMQTRPLRVPFVTCARRLERGYCPTIEVMAM